jgi:two-component system, OmpR family, sensor kinase
VTSLQAQLTAWLMGLLTVTAILAGLATGYVTLREQNELLDDQLRQIALSVGDTPSAAGNGSSVNAGVNPDDRIAVQIQ